MCVLCCVLFVVNAFCLVLYAFSLIPCRVPTSLNWGVVSPPFSSCLYLVFLALCK
eukprot:m.54793 g.54793  ORF g.54793 m.54793 type:complete len:55 (-) comp11921_c0_seq3:37-201(-)